MNTLLLSKEGTAVKFSPILCQIDFIVSQKQCVVLLDISGIVFDNYFDGRMLC